MKLEENNNYLVLKQFIEGKEKERERERDRKNNNGRL